ncbi:ras-related protein Rab-44 [Perognathus longimembris pacificus]|uniref:ras-related protein Rab-44 n=1 Tax=Perognathus longimembris pacificus TaxID=214514 RepID=UPI002019C289|nr:ras-related protein Rab-44 [Perognathus longimembris pacificus]
MESGQSSSRRSRKLGSSRRRRRGQMGESADGQDTPGAPEAWSPQATAELQAFFQRCGARQRGFVTREDLVEAQLSFLGSEEPRMVFDWVDEERKGHLSPEEFSSGLWHIFGSDLSPHGLRRGPAASRRAPASTRAPALEEAEPRDEEAFPALAGRPGADHFLPERETWQLWGELRQGDPQMAEALEGLLAKTSLRLQEARADRAALERSLRKRDSDHRQEIQWLYKETEQQIAGEKQQLQAQSDSRDLALSARVREELEAKEREARRLAEGQRELEAQLRHLSAAQQEALLEKKQLQEAEQDLAGRLEAVRGQLQVTRGHLDAAQGRVSWQKEEEPSLPRASEKTQVPQAAPPEDTPLPGVFGDRDDWDQLLSTFSSTPHGAPQLSWSPPPTPTATSGPQTPRVVRQISISEPCALLSDQGLASEPDGALRNPPGGPPSTQDGEGVDPVGKASPAQQPVEPHGLGPNEEPEPHLPGGRLGAPAGEPGSLVAAVLEVLTPWGDGSPPSPSPQALAGPRQGEAIHQDLHEPGPGAFPEGPTEPSKGLGSVGQTPREGQVQSDLSPARQEDGAGVLGEAGCRAAGPGDAGGLPVQGVEEEPRAEEGKPGDRGRLSSASEQPAGSLEMGYPESPQKAAQPGPSPADTPRAPGEDEAPARGEAAGSQGSAQSPSAQAELESHPGPPPLPAQAAREARPLPAKEPGAAGRLEGPERASGEPVPSSPPGDHMAGSPADPDHLFHVIFLGDSNVGKTSFLHLLHENSFAAGLAATVGVDFRVKNLWVDNKLFALQLWDTAGQERYRSVTRQLLRKAEGVVLMYDVTSHQSFAHVRYWLDCLQDAGADGAVILLLGNKMDCEEGRQVSTEAGHQLAQELGVSFGECSAALGHNILEPMVNLARSLKVQEDLVRSSLVKVAPGGLPKKGRCCF